MRQYVKGTLAERVWPKVDVRTPEECWPWTAVIQTNGYGKTTLDGRRQLGAHVAVWMLANGCDDPPSLCVLHLCDTRACCNPAHLMLGTHAENMRQMVERGRSLCGERHYSMIRPDVVRRGERHPGAKLSDADVLEIRRRYASGETNFTHLGRDYGIWGTQVRDIVRYRRWGHLR